MHANLVERLYPIAPSQQAQPRLRRWVDFIERLSDGTPRVRTPAAPTWLMSSARDQPLPSRFWNHTPMWFESLLSDAMQDAGRMGQAALQHLPAPVRFRAVGAVKSWRKLLDLPHMKRAKAAVCDARIHPFEARWIFFNELCNSIYVDELCIGDLGALRQTVDMLEASLDMLRFWLRGGSLYEPSPPLDVLLSRSDVSLNLPAKLLKPPVPALCLVPSPRQREHCAGASSILLFDRDMGAQTEGGRELLISAYFPCPNGNFYGQWLCIGYDGPDNLGLYAILDRAIDHQRRYAVREVTAQSDEQIAGLFANWRRILEYVAKMLLYLQHEGAVVRQHRPYSHAPRAFANLGKRKREQRLAEIEQLYDRYIVGPESLPDDVRERTNSESGFREVAPHWRRGHFRLQSYGPQASLRKVMFQPPILVRADRLAGAL